MAQTLTVAELVNPTDIISPAPHLPEQRRTAAWQNLREKATRKLVRQFVAAGRPILDPSGGNYAIIGALLQEIEGGDVRPVALYTNMETSDQFSAAFFLASRGHIVILEPDVRPGHEDPHLLSVY